MNEQLVIKDFFSMNKSNEGVGLDRIYHEFRDIFRELSDLGDLIDKLYIDLSPITYDTEFKHNLFYDNKDKIYRYQLSVFRIDNVDVYLGRDNNISFNISNTGVNELRLISNFVYENKDVIKYILEVYKKYYSLFCYDSNEIGNVLGTYYLDDMTYISVYSNGMVKLFSNYYNITDKDISKVKKISISGKLDSYCRKLVLNGNNKR